MPGISVELVPAGHIVCSLKTLQKFASVHGTVHNHFNQERHLTDRETYKANRSAALAEWQTLMA
jgi:putative transposase